MSSQADAHHAQEAWRPRHNPWLIAVSVMLATFMVVLDSSVANVALPHIAGNLSASTDESTWVLTSYLVSNAIMLPATAWVARRMGRKRLLITAIVAFTLASLLCGLSVSLPMLIVARVLQGLGGAGMQPLAQAIMLESFPLQQRGTAMSAYGMGVVVAPVIGPTLGGWITDSYSWRWIFYINLPVGLLALLLVLRYVEDPPYLRHKTAGAIDYLGLGLMAVGLGALQLVLDKGQEADWFGASWICWTALLTVATLAAFIWRELATPEPIVQLGILRDANFALGVTITTVFGVILYGVTAQLPLLMQTLLGYPALASGLSVSPRGLGALLSMFAVGLLLRYVDERLLLTTGFLMLGLSTWMFAHLNLEISMVSVAWPNFLNGFSCGLIYVPLTTLSMNRLKNHEIGNATGIYNLMRNIGGSVGIAMVTTLLARGAQRHESYLVGDVSVYHEPFRQLLSALSAQFVSAGLSAVAAQQAALAKVGLLVAQQASLLAYLDDFRLLGWMALACIPLVLLFRKRMQKSR